MLSEIRLTIRTLLRTPSFTFIAVLALALGIGANAALFSIVNAVVLRPLDFAEPDRLVMVWETRPDRGVRSNVVSNANYLDWRSRTHVFDAMSPVFSGSSTLLAGPVPEEVRTQFIGDEFFPMLGTSMQVGRTFSAAECKPGAPSVVILSDSLWRQKFSADPGIVGRSVRLGADAAVVVGVAPAGLLSISDRPPALWRNARIAGADSNGRRASGRNMAVLARLKRGISPQQADAEMVQIARQLELEYPAFNSNWSARVSPLAEEMMGKYRTPLFVLLGAVAFVLLISCANVANLLLTRAVGRSREVAVRLSLGATRWAIARQLLIESLTLAITGCLAGLALGWWLLEILRIAGPGDLRRLSSATMDWQVVTFSVVLSLFTGLLLSFAPLLVASRQTLGLAIRDGARGATSSGSARYLREAFTIAEVALSLMLLAGAGLLLKSFARLTAVDPGFRAEQVLTMDLSLTAAKYDDQKGVQFFSELSRRIRQVPGVVNASNITFLPFKGPGAGTYHWRADREKPSPGQEPITDVRMIQPGYFETMNIPLLRGRLFSEADNRADAPLRFVVNEAMAKALFRGEDPIGRSIVVQMGATHPPGEIIGVTGNVRHSGLDGQIRSMVYYPQAKLFFNFGTVVVRAAVDPSMLIRPIAGIVHDMDPELAVNEVGSMQGWIDQSIAKPKFQAGLLSGFAALALLLAIIGIYGVMSYSVAQRTHEIGVRMALGAQQFSIAKMILSRSATLTAIGMLLGVGGTLILGRYLESLLFEVMPSDPITIAAVAMLLFSVSLAASLAPARRAAKVDPLLSIRYE